eukprot:5332944-Amphidinium_carterae.1
MKTTLWAAQVPKGQNSSPENPPKAERNQQKMKDVAKKEKRERKSTEKATSLEGQLEDSGTTRPKSHELGEPPPERKE